MTFALRAWPRHLFEQNGGEPFLVYYVYGNFQELPTMRVDKYNSSGVPHGLDLQMYNRQQHEEVLDGFVTGTFGDFLRQKEDIDGAVRTSPHCIILKGTPKDSSSLDYLRDCIGVLMYLLDCGGVAVLDPQTLSWWRPAEWKEVFESPEILPARHVTIIGSPEENMSALWLHTRGMRKFGRPDLSIRSVNEQRRPAALELIERLVNYQAFGGIIAEGEELALDTVEGVFCCNHQGDDEDPDFNNRHVALEFRPVDPAGAAAVN